MEGLETPPLGVFSLPAEAALQSGRRRLFVGLHAEYLAGLGSGPLSLEAFYAVSLKMGGAYWATTSLWLLGLRSAACAKRLARLPTKDGEEENLQRTVQPPDDADHCLGCRRRRECSVCDTDGEGQEGSSVAPFKWLSKGLPEDCLACGAALNRLLETREEHLFRWILRCRRPCGGFANEEGHDAHVVATHYALLMLAGLGRLQHLADAERTAEWIKKLQTPEGAFRGDAWGEADSRFSYCAVASLTLLGALDASVAERAVAFVRSLLNSDGGFAWVPGGESHAASAFCSLAALALCEGFSAVDRERVASWLIERQTEAGGFNGRPEKAPDVCYSFWICAAMHMLGYGDWVQREKLCDFVLAAQDEVYGGIADRPGDVADVFHTFFGLAAIGLCKATPFVESLHPVLALPVSVVEQLDLPGCILLA